jgi:hypothetical protein
LKIAALLLAGLCVVGSPRAVAQDTSSQSTAADGTAEAITNQQLALLRRDIRSIKKQLIAANLTLADSEATKFWQVYEQYPAETEKINDARTVIIKEYSEEYGTLTDAQADGLIRWLDTDIEQTKLRQRYVPIFRKVLPGKQGHSFNSTAASARLSTCSLLRNSPWPSVRTEMFLDRRDVRDRTTNRLSDFISASFAVRPTDGMAIATSNADPARLSAFRPVRRAATYS